MLCGFGIRISNQQTDLCKEHYHSRWKADSQRSGLVTTTTSCIYTRQGPPRCSSSSHRQRRFGSSVAVGCLFDVRHRGRLPTSYSTIAVYDMVISKSDCIKTYQTAIGLGLLYFYSRPRRGVYPYLLMAQVSHGQFWGGKFSSLFYLFC